MDTSNKVNPEQDLTQEELNKDLLDTTSELHASAYLPSFTLLSTETEIQNDKVASSKRKREDDVVDPNKKAVKKSHDKRNKIKVIHLGQVHARPFEEHPDTKFMDIVINCQLLIGHYILRNLNCLVVQESISTDYTDPMQIPSWHKDIKRVFPKGFPANIYIMNDLQKKFLFEKGAVRILFFLEKIPCVYKSIHEDAAKYVRAHQDTLEKMKSTPEITFNFREEEAIKCIKEIVINKGAQSPNEDITILLVYGPDHDFEPYCIKEGFEYEFVDYLFPYRTYMEENKVKLS